MLYDLILSVRTVMKNKLFFIKFEFFTYKCFLLFAILQIPFYYFVQILNYVIKIQKIVYLLIYNFI